MNVTVQILAPCRKLVRVDVDAATVDQTFEQVTNEVQRHVTLPGFRPGKAPRQMVAKAYAKHVEDEVKRKLIGDYYQKALDTEKIHAVGAPDIEEIQFGRGQDLQFAATIETAPEFEMPEYKGLPVKREIATVTDEDVERAINTLRGQRVSYRDLERPAQEGDILVVNYTGTSEGKPLTDFAPTARGLTQQKDFWIEMKKDAFVPGFFEQLLGSKAGDKKTVQVTFPADFVSNELSGRQGVYEVEVTLVKEKVLPEPNDDFAKAYGAESMEKLREGVRQDLSNELTFKQRRMVRNQLIHALVERVQCDLPESLVKHETRNVVFDIVRDNQARGIPKEAIDKQKDEIYNYAANNAKERVKIAFLLGRVADMEGIKVSQDEMAQRIAYLAQENQMKPEKYVKQLKENNGFGEIHEQILSAKTLDFLEKSARIEDVAPSQPQ